MCRDFGERVIIIHATGYDAVPVRARAEAIAQQCGGAALDVGAGAGACLAVALARQGLNITALDHAVGAVRIAQEQAAGELGDRLDVRYGEAGRLPFANEANRVVAAFDALCHAVEPAGVLAEMSASVRRMAPVIITELNAAGRQATQHRDGDFEQRLLALLAPYCPGCQRIADPHHITYVCRRNTHVSPR